MCRLSATPCRQLSMSLICGWDRLADLGLNFSDGKLTLSRLFIPKGRRASLIPVYLYRSAIFSSVSFGRGSAPLLLMQNPVPSTNLTWHIKHGSRKVVLRFFFTSTRKLTNQIRRRKQINGDRS